MILDLLYVLGIVNLWIIPLILMGPGSRENSERGRCLLLHPPH